MLKQVTKHYKHHHVLDDGEDDQTLTLGKVNTAAVVTIAQYNTLVARCSRQLVGPAVWVFVTLGPLHCD